MTDKRPSAADGLDWYDDGGTTVCELADAEAIIHRLEARNAELEARNAELEAQVETFRPGWELTQIRAGNCTFEDLKGNAVEPKPAEFKIVGIEAIE